MPKVSIIIPVYNVKDYVRQCVLSVVSQTYKDLEIIIVDDGSSDGSSDLCDRIAEEDGRITVVHKPNGGLSSARNAGIDAATGSWYMFLDGDDRLETDTVEKLVAAAKENEYPDIIQYKYSEVDENGKPIYTVTATESIETVTDEREKYDRLYRLGGCGASACTKFMSSRLFEGLRFKEGIIHEDEYIVTDLLSRSDKVVYYDIAPYLYFFRNNSIVTSGFSKKKLDVFKVIKRRISVLNEKGYYDLVNKEYERMFVLIPSYYAKAKASGCSSEAAYMKGLLESIPDSFFSTLDIKRKIKFFLIKKISFMPDIIYIYKKLFNRI